MGSLARSVAARRYAGDAHPAVITLRVPPHELGDLRPGSRVAIRVDGGAVLYPSDDAGVVTTTSRRGAPARRRQCCYIAP